MRRFVFALTLLGSAALAFVPPGAHSQDFGPGTGGATLKQPWADSPAAARPKAARQTPEFLQSLLQSSGAASPLPANSALANSLQPYDSMGINNDILVTAEVGPWVILVASYGGPEGPMRGRQMVSVLRGTYKLPAYVFNFGAEEKRKELARVMKLIEEQKAKLKQELREHSLPEDFTQPIRVRHEKIEEYCGVLIGGYPTVEAASAARNKLRQLKLEPKDFTLKTPGDLLDVKFYTSANDPKAQGQADAAYVNPFARAVPVPNPTIKTQRSTEKLDVAALRHMNSEEEFSVFKCRKKYTLAIKQFNLPAQAVTRKDPGPGSWLGLGKSAPSHGDYAAENAHKLAEALRKQKLEAYVLHMKYYSLVTVGGYDSLDDPNLRSMQSLLDTRLLPRLETLQMFPRATPMEIPR